MTRCVAAGVGLREIEKHLDRRSMKVKNIKKKWLLLSIRFIYIVKITRRPGNAKDWRTKDAEEVLV